MVIERERSVSRPQMRYMSYYGLSLAQTKRPSRQAIKACETAATVDFFSPDLLLNLGKVYLLAGKTSKALARMNSDVSPTARPMTKTRRGDSTVTSAIAGSAIITVAAFSSS